MRISGNQCRRKIKPLRVPTWNRTMVNCLKGNCSTIELWGHAAALCLASIVRHSVPPFNEKAARGYARRVLGEGRDFFPAYRDWTPASCLRRPVAIECTGGSSNPRPPDRKPGALPTELPMRISNRKRIVRFSGKCRKPREGNAFRHEMDHTGRNLAVPSELPAPHKALPARKSASLNIAISFFRLQGGF